VLVIVLDSGNANHISKAGESNDPITQIACLSLKRREIDNEHENESEHDFGTSKH
jgi:hypothetical protein